MQSFHHILGYHEWEEEDIVPNLSPESHIRRVVKETNYLVVVKETNYLVVNIRIAFKYIDWEIFSKFFMSCIRPKLECGFQIWSLHLAKEAQRDPREGPKEDNKDSTRIMRARVEGMAGGFKYTHL